MGITIRCKKNGLERVIEFWPHIDGTHVFSKGTTFNYVDDKNTDLEGIYKVKKVTTKKMVVVGNKAGEFISNGTYAKVDSWDYILDIKKIK